jgi:hypothetical protein
VVRQIDYFGRIANLFKTEKTLRDKGKMVGPRGPADYEWQAQGSVDAYEGRKCKGKGFLSYCQWGGAEPIPSSMGPERQLNVQLRTYSSPRINGGIGSQMCQ